MFWSESAEIVSASLNVDSSGPLTMSETREIVSASHVDSCRLLALWYVMTTIKHYISSGLDNLINI